MTPTIVLVHGAFAESSSWDTVVNLLLDAGHPVIAAANPLRSGAVMSNVPADAGDIVWLVYADSFAPQAGESCFALPGKFPGGTLGETTVRPVPRSDGATDLFITVDRFHELFCADVPAAQAARMALTERPATQEALIEPSGERSLRKEVPSQAIAVSQSEATARLILEAAASRVAV